MEETSELTRENICNGGNDEENQVKVESSASRDITTDIPMECNENKGNNKLIGKKFHSRFKKKTSKQFHLVQNDINPGTSLTTKGFVPTNFKQLISRDMTREDKKMLNYYKTRLTSLKRDNDLLHKRIVFIVNENMRLLKVN